MFRNLFNSMFFVYQTEAGDEHKAGGGDAVTPPPDTTTTDTENPGGSGAGDEVKPEGSELKQEDGPGTVDEPEFFYGESSVGIEIPDDVSAELSAKGLDAKVLAAELYRKDGNFELTKETREKVDAIYGKFAVDAYLNALKTQNDSFLRSGVEQAAAKEQADSARFAEVAGLVGGEEGWDKLTAWGNENLSPEEIDELNEVMQSGNTALQKFAIQMLHNKQRAADGDPEAVLVEADQTATREGGALSAEAYRVAEQELRKTFRGNQRGYQEAVAKLDTRRRAGQAKGI